MAPYRLDLIGMRGDGFRRAVPLNHPDGRPLSAAEAQVLIDTYPVIELQVRPTAESATLLLDLSSARGELRIEPAEPGPGGRMGPALLIEVASGLLQPLIWGVYDLQFSGPQAEPYTWLAGEFGLTQDVTRAPG
jgi:hypothetical protein